MCLILCFYWYQDFILKRTREGIKLFMSFLGFRLIAETLIELTGKNRSAPKRYVTFFFSQDQ